MSAEQEPGFRVSLDVFEGPFDLLLQLIAKHQLDVTAVALSQVTDEFIAYVRLLDEQMELEQTSSFLVVASTLLDLKTARLLPREGSDSDEEIAFLEARDLLFARLMQYRAYKEVSYWLADRFDSQQRIFTHPGGLDDRFIGLLPDVVIDGGAQAIFESAVRAFRPKDDPAIPYEQLHIVQISVNEQANIIAERLRRSGSLTFQQLVDCASKPIVVARFLSLLEMFRRAYIEFSQRDPLGELTITWIGDMEGEITIVDEFVTE